MLWGQRQTDRAKRGICSQEMPKSPYLERPFGSPLFTASAMLFKVVCFAGKKLIDKRFDKWVNDSERSRRQLPIGNRRTVTAEKPVNVANNIPSHISRQIFWFQHDIFVFYSGYSQLGEMRLSLFFA